MSGLLVRRMGAVGAVCILLAGCSDSRPELSAGSNERPTACASGDDPACAVPKGKASPTTAGSKRPDLAAVRKFYQEDTHRNVGQVLPDSIRVLDRSGNAIDLRTALAALNAPIILVRLEPGCQPCRDLVGYIRSNAHRYDPKQGPRLAVIEVQGEKAVDPDFKPIPEGIPVFRSGNKLDTGFLAGHISPAAFFFDKNLKLLARRAGLTTPEDF